MLADQCQSISNDPQLRKIDKKVILLSFLTLCRTSKVTHPTLVEDGEALSQRVRKL